MSAPSSIRRVPSPAGAPAPIPAHVAKGGHSRTASASSTISGIPHVSQHSPSPSASSQPSRYLRRIPVPSPEPGSGGEPAAPSMSRQGSSSNGFYRPPSSQGTADVLLTPREAPIATLGPPVDGRGRSSSPNARPASEGGRATPASLNDVSRAAAASVSPPPRATSSQQQFYLPVDRPTPNMLPTYPPPPPPADKHGRPLPSASAAGKGREKKAKPVGKVLSKREVYLRNKHKQSGPDDPYSDREGHDEGVVPFPGGHYRESTDNELSPLLSSAPSTTWSLQSELEFVDLPKNKIDKARLKGPDIEPFSADSLPSTRRMWEAGLCEVQDENGDYVPFSELIRGDGGRRTAVFFIRHFWCGQCQDYMGNSIPELDPVVLERHKIDVIIVSNGHWQIIKKYREIFSCPFPVYVDGPRRLYNYLGMTLLNNDFGSMKQADRSRYNVNTVPGQLVRGIGNGLFRMPLRDPGKLVQLGGEFVFSNASTCLFAHRMVHTSDHMEAVDVLAEIGIDPEEFFPADGTTPTASTVQLPLTDKERIRAQLDDVASAITDEEQRQQDEYDRNWEARREAELARMRQAKEDRRAGKGRESGDNSPATPGASAFASVGDEFRRRGELDDDDYGDDDDDRNAGLTDAERARNARAWSEDEQISVLSEGLSCARVESEGESPTHGREREDSSATVDSQFQGPDGNRTSLAGSSTKSGSNGLGR